MCVCVCVCVCVAVKKISSLIIYMVFYFWFGSLFNRISNHHLKVNLVEKQL